MAHPIDLFLLEKIINSTNRTIGLRDHKKTSAIAEVFRSKEKEIILFQTRQCRLMVQVKSRSFLRHSRPMYYKD